MQFNLEHSILFLERTPLILETQLKGLPEIWTSTNEGPDTWSPFDVVGHLIYGEKADWIPRLEIIMSSIGNKTFEPFDRFAMFNESEGKNLNQLLEEFKQLREKNLTILKAKKITPEDYTKTAIHPVLGEVMLSNLLSCWVAHDLSHLAQINRVMAKQYKEEIGPWIEFFRMLQ
ncbi:DinB family protein [Flavobacterium sp.]|uniref:DinB family protein n=1 Tax=Flavobacterium sp. TaxID=239 RepID=UPI003D6B9A10